MKKGIFARGILIDVPRFKGMDCLPAGYEITARELQQTLQAQKVDMTKCSGDVLFLRTGYPLLKEKGCAGFGWDCFKLLQDWQVAVLGTDRNGEVSPPRTAEVTHATHIIALRNLGIPIIDNANFEPLANACLEESRWEFAVSINPLPLQGGTGAPCNPIVHF
eukprot:TRINITY_DN8589_c0_g1_i1.p1 TRINITY_DN8589_c0_g1~~TRINITY_DN8589_c0_g1_i1.p1  ORF type:complete len:163 (+),score=24.92 TRINITY_DN8589_c0_g1_i1:3-491(+)